MEQLSYYQQMKNDPEFMEKRRKLSREYYKRNRDKLTAKQREKRYEDPERLEELRRRSREYNQQHKEDLSRNMKKYYEENKEKHKEVMREYRKNNLERLKAQERARYAARKAAKQAEQ